jgi:hypothetical protein
MMTSFHSVVSSSSTEEINLKKVLPNIVQNEESNLMLD